MASVRVQGYTLMFVGSVRPIRGVCFVFGSSSHLLFSKTPPLPFCHPHSPTLRKMDWACFITIHRIQLRKLRARSLCGGLDCKTADNLSRDLECLKARNVYCTKQRMDEETQVLWPYFCSLVQCFTRVGTCWLSSGSAALV
jgi:hypothetical protein